MKRFYWLSAAIVVAQIWGCSGFRAAGEIQRGRHDLLTGNPELALAHFHNASQLDPKFVYDFSPLQQSVWTYLGRAYYQAGKLAEARRTLEQARGEVKSDYMAGLYLGLTDARNERYESALPQIQGALKGLHEWLDEMEYYTLYGHFWDPGKKLRNQIQVDLDMLAGRDVDWSTLIADAEWLGKELEEEIDRARYDKSFHRRKHDRFRRLTDW